MKGGNGGTDETGDSWRNRWGEAVILCHPWQDPCLLLLSALFGPCGLWGFYLFDPSGLSGLVGPSCLCPQYRRRTDQSLCLSLCLGLCLYWLEKELLDKDVQGVPQLACVKDHYRQ